MQRCYQFNSAGNPNGVASVEINAAEITGAEQDIVILDTNGKAIAVIQVQPGYDSEIVEQHK